MISSTSGLYPDAKPRVIEPSGSCSSLVVHEILDLWDKDTDDLAFEGECINVSAIHLLGVVILLMSSYFIPYLQTNNANALKAHPTDIPMELADLLLAVISLDTDDFHRGNGRDLHASKAVWRWSSFCGGDEDRDKVMDRYVKVLESIIVSNLLF